MKNKIAILLGMVLCAASAPAEVVESVSFNPSRLGQFERLKISDRLNAPGGVQSSRMTVHSGNRVAVENAGNYQLDYALPSGKVAMPGTQFEAANLKAKGGEGEFGREGNSYVSTVNTLQGDMVRLKANVLKVNQINVEGSPATSYDDNSIQGLELGLNDIPNPSTGSTGNCSLQWVERKADDGNKYQVLAANCASISIKPPACTNTCASGFTQNKYNCACECNKTCPTGKKLKSSTCTCVDDGQWCLGLTSARKAATSRFELNSAHTGGCASTSGMMFLACAPSYNSSNDFWAAAKSCYSVSDPFTAYANGANLGCTPGKACAACSQTANQSKRWVFNFQCSTSSTHMAGSQEPYVTYGYAWDEAYCQYSSDDCSKLLGGSDGGLISVGDKELLLP